MRRTSALRLRPRTLLAIMKPLLLSVFAALSLVACVPSLQSGPGALAVDAPAPNARLVDLSAKPVSLDALSGQPLLVNVWGVWCKPCLEEIPELKAIQDQFKAQGLVVIGINFLDSRERLDTYLKDNPLNYAVWLEGQGTDRVRLLLASWQRYTSGSVSVPYSFAINRAGKVTGVLWNYKPGSKELENLAQSALK